MTDPDTANERQEQPDATATPVEPAPETAAPVPDGALSPSAMQVTTSHVAVPTPPVILYIQAATAEDETGSHSHPRAIYPFGWSLSDVQRWIGLTLAAILAVVFLWLVQSILPPFVIAFAFAALLDPTIRYFERHGYSRLRSILTLYLIGLAAIGAFFTIIVPIVTNQVNEISGNFEGYSSEVMTFADRYMQDHTQLLDRLNIKQRNVKDLIDQHSGPIRKAISDALGSLTATLGGLASKVLWLVIIPVATFFLMRDYPVIRARLIALFPEIYQDRIDSMSREVVDVFSAYIRGLAKICGLYSIIACILFWLLGLQYWLFLGLLAGAFYAVPYVGQLVTALGSGIVAFMMDAHRVLFFIPVDTHSVRYTVLVVIVAVVVQNVFDQLLYPRLVGGSVGLHPVVSIFSLMAGATLFGVWGMLLAVPVAASLQILLTTFFPKLVQKPPARLLEPSPPLA